MRGGFSEKMAFFPDKVAQAGKDRIAKDRIARIGGQ
jgi:hypothetical protein